METKKIKSLVEKIFNSEDQKADKSLESQNKEIVKELSEKNQNDVFNDLYEIERKLKNGEYLDAPESLGLQKVEVEEKSDDDFIKAAENSLKSKYDQKKESTSGSFESKIDDLLKNKESLKKSSEEKKNQINEIYDDTKKETESQALKRGLARSSVVINQLASIEGSRAKDLSSVLNDLNDKLNESEEKLRSLESEKEKALEDLDLEYAIELQSEIESEKEAYEKKKNEAIEFNNNVDKLEAEYKLKRDDQVLQRQDQQSKLKEKYGDDYMKEQIKDKQYDYLKSYFDSINTGYALVMLSTNSEFKKLLGDKRYDQLLKYLEAKR